MADCTWSADIDNITRLSSLLRELLLEKEIENDVIKNIFIQRRVKHLQNGDAFVPRGRIANISSKVWTEVLSEIEARTRDWPIPFTCAEPNKDNAAVFHWNRTKAFQHVLRKVKKQGQGYGVTSLAKAHRILLNCAHLYSHNRIHDLSQTRALLLLSHIVNLLRSNGYSVVGIIPVEVQADDDIQHFLNIDTLIDINSKSLMLNNPDAKSSYISRLLEAAADSAYRHLEKEDDVSKTNADDVSKTNADDVSKTNDDETGSALLMDLRSFLDSNDMSSCPVRGFDKNLNLIEVCHSEKPKPILEQVSFLEQCIVSSKKEAASIDSILHFTPSSLFYTQQQVHLLWKMLSPTPHSLQQFHVEFGPVQKRKGIEKTSGTLDALTYLRKRQEQMEDAAKMKYGILGQGAEWESMMRGLLNACVKFELLRTVCRNVVKVDLLDWKERPDATIDNQAGPFVIYNCARLAMLFENYRKAVKQGVYPKLPLISKCDMSTLKLEEEWLLFYNFVEPYPSLVQSTLSLVTDSVRSEIHTHKVVSFLVSLSHCFSSYYSRVHILTEPRPHLLPTMFARLHLMSAVHQVMQNALRLLDIIPPRQL